MRLHGRARASRGPSRRPFARRRGLPRSGAQPSRPGGLGRRWSRRPGSAPRSPWSTSTASSSASRARKLKPVLEMLVANPALVTSDMVEDVLKFKRLDGVDAALNTIAGASFRRRPAEPRLARRGWARSAPVQVIWGREDRDPAGRPRRGPAGRGRGHRARRRRPSRAHGEGGRGQRARSHGQCPSASQETRLYVEVVVGR